MLFLSNKLKDEYIINLASKTVDKSQEMLIVIVKTRLAICLSLNFATHAIWFVL